MRGKNRVKGKRRPPLWRLLVTVTAAVILGACATTNFGAGVSGLNGMVYDFENRPVANYAVTLDGGAEARTDINGRFLLPRAVVGVRELSGSGDGFESFHGTITVTGQGQIVYLRVPSTAQLLDRAEEALTRNRLADAEDYALRAYAVGEFSPELYFTLAVTALRKGAPREAAAWLREALAGGFTDEYLERFYRELLAFSPGGTFPVVDIPWEEVEYDE